jgi:hypothetical protein
MTTLPKPSRALTIGTVDRRLERNASLCDLSELAFVDAYGLVEVACALRVAIEDEPDLEVLRPESKPMRSHLAAMGFADFLAGIRRRDLLSADPTHDASDVVVPLRDARASGGEQAISNLLWGRLREHVDPQVLQAIAEGLWEIVGNALEHSGADASVMAQVYWANRAKEAEHANRVQVVVGDTGRGIRETFLSSGTQEPRDDVDAIQLALEYLVTSVPDDPGRGQGLYTTMEETTGLQGRLIVRSGTGKVSVTQGGREPETVPFLRGTIVALDLPLYPGS